MASKISDKGIEDVYFGTLDQTPGASPASAMAAPPPSDAGVGPTLGNVPPPEVPKKVGPYIENLPRAGGLESFARAALDSASLGGGPKIMAHLKDPRTAILGGAPSLPALMDNMINPRLNHDTEAAYFDKARKDHPWISTAGDLAGGILGGKGMADVGRAAVNAAREVPYLRGIVNLLTVPRPMSAVVTPALAGGGMGAVEAYNKDQPTLPGLMQGVAYGGLGGAAAEGLGMLSRLATKSSSVTNARRNLGAEITNNKEEPARALEGGLDIDAVMSNNPIRPDDSLMDISEGARKTARSYIGDPNKTDDLPMIKNLLGAREDSATGDLAQFAATIKKLMPSGFSTFDDIGLATLEGGKEVAARAKGSLINSARSYTQSLQSDYDKVLDLTHQTYKVDKLRERMAKEVWGNVTKKDAGQRAAFEDVFKMIDEENPDDLRGMFNLRKAIDTKIDDSLKPDAKALVKSMRSEYVKARKVVTDELNKVPGLADLNNKYATSASYRRSYDIGRDLLKNTNRSLSAEELDSFVESANPGDRMGLWEGITREVTDQLSKSGGEKGVLRKMTADDNVVQKLKILFPDNADQMIDAANKVIEHSTTTKMVMSGATAAEKSAIDARLGNNTSVFDKLLVVLMGTGMINSGRFGASQASGLGALRRLIPGFSDPKESAEIDRLVTSTGADNIRRSLGQAKQASDLFTLPKSLGGADKTLGLASGEVPNTMINRLLGMELGSTLPNALSLGLLSHNANAPQKVEERNDARKNMYYPLQ